MFVSHFCDVIKGGIGELVAEVVNRIKENNAYSLKLALGSLLLAILDWRILNNESVIDREIIEFISSLFSRYKDTFESTF